MGILIADYERMRARCEQNRAVIRAREDSDAPQQAPRSGEPDAEHVASPSSPEGRSGQVTAALSAPASREKDLHADILSICRGRSWLCVHARMDRASTIGVGCPDFVVFADKGRVFVVEAKSRTGKLTPEQRAWLAWLEKLGHGKKAKVVRSLTEFLEFVSK